MIKLKKGNPLGGTRTVRMAVLAMALAASSALHAQVNMGMSAQDMFNQMMNSMTQMINNMKFEGRYYHDDYNRLFYVQSNNVTADIIVALILGQREHWVNLTRGGTMDGLPYYPIPGVSAGITLSKDDGRYFLRMYRYDSSAGGYVYNSFIDCPTAPNAPACVKPDYCRSHYNTAFPDEYAPYEIYFQALSQAQQMQTTGAGLPSVGSSGTTVGTTRQPKQCGLCNGSGRMVKNDAVDFGGTKYCEECRQVVSQSHYHAPCISCGGKGQW